MKKPVKYIQFVCLSVLALMVAGCATMGNHYESGQTFQSQANYDAAIAAYYQALQQEPDRVDVHLGLSEVFLLKGLHEEALKAAEKAHELAPQDKQVKVRLADFYFKQGKRYREAGKLSDAFETWQRVLILNPDHIQTNGQLAQLYSDQGQDDKAAQQYQRLTQSQPRDVNAHQALGLVYYKQGKLDAAIKQFQQVLRLNPSDAKAYNNLGSVYLKVNRLNEAMTAFEQAVGLDPRLTVAYNNWGTSFFRQGRYLKAREKWLTARHIQPENKRAKQNLDSLERLGY